nr:transcriptional repressor [Cellulophaga sp. HaHaR_3_176]
MNRRNTPTKEAILKLLLSSRKALSQDAIERALTIDINRATIYRVLNRFCEADIIHKIVAKDGKKHFVIYKKNVRIKQRLFNIIFIFDICCMIPLNACK